ncbi:hypothetical protein ABT324_28135 [Saccharopolyspora sp. NPDC000359]|uniref:hypothetical protein n=1 Tax=Saccharopolyspora sp. NPDC000359 TaxID=3154251 RepID=UPI0033296DA2
MANDIWIRTQRNALINADLIVKAWSENGRLKINTQTVSGSGNSNDWEVSPGQYVVCALEELGGQQPVDAQNLSAHLVTLVAQARAQGRAGIIGARDGRLRFDEIDVTEEATG